ncbi:hypothetical protein [Bifidobacterium sp. ESL0745]|uniref:hypothetical protein n=1 Tax=Bifidobacterium sp. ESL0745 TaxID=2983226 RepID=UPI0023F678B2|nr:hypothetical protein [Bifidobacterium sp. ESL0745]MDF7665919.1 hypothetical protein [Bifidobacterium sp. ESL0745]
MTNLSPDLIELLLFNVKTTWKEVPWPCKPLNNWLSALVLVTLTLVLPKTVAGFSSCAVGFCATDCVVELAGAFSAFAETPTPNIPKSVATVAAVAMGIVILLGILMYFLSSI